LYDYPKTRSPPDLKPWIGSWTKKNYIVYAVIKSKNVRLLHTGEAGSMPRGTSDLHATNAVLTSHVLDLLTGRPATGVEVALFRLDAEEAHPVCRLSSNIDGRFDAPLLSTADAVTGGYRLEFSVGSFLGTQTGYLRVVPVEFAISDPTAHYHVPLILSPFGYSTYRGAPPDRAPRDGERWAVTAPDANGYAATPPGPGSGALTTHVIDIARGCGGGPMTIDVLRLDEERGQYVKLAEAQTTTEGRTMAPLIPEGNLTAGTYELAFHIGRYFQDAGFALGTIPFFEKALVRFSVGNSSERHHIPLLAAPWGYTTYRGS
jgi:5-hydroxyisourate hydrolase